MNTTISILKRNILPIALPLVIEQALIMTMGLVNTAMATNLGRSVASAIGVVDSLSWMVISLAQAMAIGGTVVVAQHTGRRDRDAANRAVTQAILSGLGLGLVLGVLFALFRRPIIEVLFAGLEPAVQANAETYLGITAAGYPFLLLSLVASGVLRGAGDARLPMLVNVGVNIINALAGWLLMYGVGSFGGLGIQGAAWAITLARAAGGIAFLCFLMSGRKAATLPRPKHLRYDHAVLKSILAIGIPTSIESLMFNGGKLLAQMYSVSLGTLAITANFVATSVAGIAQIPATALSLAVTPLVGNAVGRGSPTEARTTILVTTGLSMASLVACCIPLFLASGPFVQLYTRDADIITQTRGLINLFCITAPFLWGPSFVLPSGLRGGGDSRFVMLVSMVSMWVVRVCAGYLLGITLGLGMAGIWLAMMADWLVRSAFFLWRFFKGPWIHPLASSTPAPEDPEVKQLPSR